jgi:hypothetical protein
MVAGRHRVRILVVLNSVLIVAGDRVPIEPAPEALCSRWRPHDAAAPATTVYKNPVSVFVEDTKGRTTAERFNTRRKFFGHFRVVGQTMLLPHELGNPRLPNLPFAFGVNGPSRFDFNRGKELRVVIPHIRRKLALVVVVLHDRDWLLSELLFADRGAVNQPVRHDAF